MSALITRGHLALYAPSAEALAERPPPHLCHPVERLLRGAHLYAPQEAEWLLRARAVSAVPLNASAWGLMKVIAKRIRVASRDNVDEIFSSLCAQGLTPTLAPPLPPAHVTPLTSLKPFTSLEEASAWLLSRAEEENERCLLAGGGQESPLCPDATTPSQRRWRGARRVVAACLLTPELQPLSLAFKQPEVHPSYHAEWALLDALSRDAHTRGTSLPTHLTLLSTLKPCKLCAGAWASYGPEHLEVHYLADDPGRSGQNTAFDEGSYAWVQAQRERSQQVRLNRQPKHS